MIIKQSAITSSVSIPCLPSDTRQAITDPATMAVLCRVRATIARADALMSREERKAIRKAARRLSIAQNNARQSFLRPTGR